MADLDLKVPLARRVGDVGPDWTYTVRDANGDPEDISAWSVVGATLREHESAAVVTGGGTVSLVTATSQIKYAFVAADVAVSGMYDVILTVTNENSDSVSFTDPRPLQIDPVPS